MTRVLVIGAGGMLGRDIISEFHDMDVEGVTKQGLDIRNSAQVRAAVQGFDVVINAAAYTRVDDAETNAELAFAVNSKGAKNVARASSSAKAHLIHLSTDYVFDGTAGTPYSEGSQTNPLSVYGRSKRDGELAVIESSQEFTIVRTSWLYGAHGPNFPKTIGRLGQVREYLDIVNDQIGQPTSTVEVARLIRGIVLNANPGGIFHATTSGATSWWSFAQVLFRKAGWDPSRVRPISTDQFISPAPRPAWSVLGHNRWKSFNLAPRPWQEVLEEAWNQYLKDFFKGTTE